MKNTHDVDVIEAESSKRSSFSHSNSYLTKLSRWSVLFAALMVVIGTAASNTKLNQQADTSDRSERLLISIEMELSKLNALEWQAIAEQKLVPESLEELQAIRNNVIQSSDELRKVAPQQAKLQEIFKLYYEYNKAIDREFQLIAAGRIDDALVLDRQLVAPTYQRLCEEIEELSNIYINQKQQARQTAYRGSTLSLLVATGMIGLLLWQFNQAQYIAQLATAEQKALYRSEERFRSLVQNASDVIMLLDAEAVISYVTVSVYQVLGSSPKDLVDTNILNWVHPEDTAQMQNFFTECLANPGVTPLLELRFQRGNGEWCYVELIGNNLLDNPSVAGIAINLRDISDRKQAVELLSHNASHDTLTNLPNRSLFMERLKYAVEYAKKHDNYVFAVLFLDLDRFKIVNDSLGHAIGDELLIATARRLQTCLRTGDTIARLGGDEFAILLNGIKDVKQAADVAERIKQELTLPFNLSGNEVFISTSIGIALGSKTYGWSDDLLRNADIAMYRAKSLGRATYEVFDAAMHTQIATRLQLETDLRRAVDNQEFQVYYQPIVLLETGKVVGFEGLVRWEHPVRGLISSMEFIPLAEETGLIIPIGELVLYQACRQMRAWQVQFPTIPALTLSINLSVKQFKYPKLSEKIAQILHETNLDARSLRLEFTESLLLETTEFVTATLSCLEALGIKLYLDDFGTGYSSLSHLHCFPIDTLKIDRSFVSRMTHNNKSFEIVEASIKMAEALGMNAIAEGLETAEQLEQLVKLRCQYAQGYFFFQPLDANSAAALIAQNNILH